MIRRTVFSDFSFHSVFAGLSFFMVKAYSKGTMICHTTNILNFKFCCCVQWIKPPFLKISKPMYFYDSLSRQEYISY